MVTCSCSKMKRWTYSVFKIYRKSLWYDKSSLRWRSDLHDSIWNRNTALHTSNNWDSALMYGRSDCKYAITGMGGVHNNHREDRKFWFYSSEVEGYHSSQCKWSGWINWWDGQMNTSLGLNEYIGAVYSIHNNRREDRRWQFCYCEKY